MLTAALDLSNQAHDPIYYYGQSKCGEFYKNHAVMARVAFVSLALIQGVLKPLVFIVWSIFAAVILPLKGACCYGLRNKHGTEEHIAAGALNLLGFAAAGAFFVISAYYLPLAASTSLYMIATVFCIGVHVYRACKAPELPPPAIADASAPLPGSPPSHNGVAVDVDLRIDGSGAIVPPNGDNPSAAAAAAATSLKAQSSGVATATTASAAPPPADSMLTGTLRDALNVANPQLLG